MDLKRKICTTWTIAALCLPVALPTLANGGALTLAGAVEERVALTVTGPGDLVYTAVFEPGTTPVFALFDGKGFTHPDGSYTWELRLAPAEGRHVRGVDEPAAEKRVAAEPVAAGYFSIRGGAFVAPELREQIPAKRDVPTKDQLILDDLIVDGSLCVGMDCVNGESFGFDTIRLKENNLRIRFVDTSSTSSFPSRDWQITVNDSSDGGANKFSIDDIDGGRTPFTIEAGAPSHSLYVDDGGRIGFGTSTPVVNLHVKEGNTPTLRLEQDGSSGFTPQTWDVAGNEANFFIRDATNGSNLPFRIIPGAPSDAIYVASDGDVGFGTTSPDASLEVVRSSGGSLVMLQLENNGPVQAEFEDTDHPVTWRLGINPASDFVINDTGDVGTAEFQVSADGVVEVNGAQVHPTPDYVFDPSYELMPLDELAAFVAANRHLPNVQSAAEREQNGGGIILSELPLQILEKVEELVLYTIDQQKTIEELVLYTSDQQKTIGELRARLAALESAE